MDLIEISYCTIDRQATVGCAPSPSGYLDRCTRFIYESQKFLMRSTRCLAELLLGFRTRTLSPSPVPRGQECLSPPHGCSVSWDEDAAFQPFKFCSTTTQTWLRAGKFTPTQNASNRCLPPSGCWQAGKQRRASVCACVCVCPLSRWPISPQCWVLLQGVQSGQARPDRERTPFFSPPWLAAKVQLYLELWFLWFFCLTPLIEDRKWAWREPNTEPSYFLIGAAVAGMKTRGSC